MTEHPFPADTWHEADRTRALAELRVYSLELRLALAHVDHIGILLKQGMIQPWGARAALADLYGSAEEASE